MNIPEIEVLLSLGALIFSIFTWQANSRKAKEMEEFKSAINARYSQIETQYTKVYSEQFVVSMKLLHNFELLSRLLKRLTAEVYNRGTYENFERQYKEYRSLTESILQLFHQNIGLFDKTVRIEIEAVLASAQVIANWSVTRPETWRGPEEPDRPKEDISVLQSRFAENHEHVFEALQTLIGVSRPSIGLTKTEK